MMKNSTKRALTAVLVLSIPATLYAVSYTDVDVTGYQRIGTTNGYGALTLAVGLNNSFSNTPYYAAAIGTGLTVMGSNLLVVGKYNKYSGLTGGNPLFVVGNGTGTGSSSQNALEVTWTGVLTDKGTVNIPGTANITTVPNKGGISMGAFTAP